jgi:ABC-type oligopeptide transport system substrate-binding subunit
MSRTSLRFPVLVSIVIAAATASAARPRYGGTLRVETQATVRSLDPSAPPADAVEASFREAVFPLFFETLVAVDADGGMRPLLASSWTSDAAERTWRFTVRSGVQLHDGTELDASLVATALRGYLPAAHITVDGRVVVVDAGREGTDLLWEVAQPRRAIAVRSASGALVGTGPFRVERLEGTRLLLAAHDGHWAGRPFLDSVRIELGRALDAQLTNLETGRADMVSVRPTDMRRVGQRQLLVAASRPLELVAVVFEPERAALADLPLRRTVAGAVDRDAMVRVLFQGQGDPARALLPTWLSGYAPSVAVDAAEPLPRRVIAGLSEARRSLVLRASAGDSIGIAVAERVAVDARAAGFLTTVQVPTGLAPRADARVIRVPLAVSSPERSLSGLMSALGSRTLTSVTREPAPPPGAPLDAVARAERALLEQFVIVPIVHLPALHAASERVDVFNGPVVLPTGQWNLADVWLRPEGVSRP